MNQIKVNYQESIVLLHKQKWSMRKIARELGLDRVTVRKYVALAAKPSTPQTSPQREILPNCPPVPPGQPPHHFRQIQIHPSRKPARPKLTFQNHLPRQTRTPARLTSQIQNHPPTRKPGPARISARKVCASPGRNKLSARLMSSFPCSAFIRTWFWSTS